MKRQNILLALGACLLVGSASPGLDGAVDLDGGTGLLGGLKVGHPVTLKDLGVATRSA